MRPRHLLLPAFIGVSSALVYVLIGATLIHSGQHPLIANILASAIGFTVASMGSLGFYSCWQISNATAFWTQFALGSLLGLALSEVLLAELIRSTTLPSIKAFILAATAFCILAVLVGRPFVTRKPPPRPDPDKRIDC